ncbi:serine O-acetyltransferase [Mesorhizobium sp. NPDC059054]|uniref:serine O-acetyltransferase n=1 Tax=Mesorhizobium sp. NPDC059054 TaxID=3346711 RepID=UPI0036BBE77F
MADQMSCSELLRADLLRQHNLLYGDHQGAPSGLRLWLGVWSPRFVPVLLCRIAHSLHRRRLEPIAKLVSLLNFFAFGIEIAVRCPIGPGLFLPHTQGTVIGAWSIGANATIFQGVTLGAREIDFSYTEQSRPTLGNGVTVGAGAKVLGGVMLGSDSRIGANSVVLSDIPAGVLAVGAPARGIDKIRSLDGET